MSFTNAGFGTKAVMIGRANVATALTSVPADRLGFDDALIVLSHGAVADTRTVTVNIQSSATSGGSYTTITGASHVVAPAEDDLLASIVFHVDLRGAQRFIQATATVGGTGDFTTHVIAVLQSAKYTPDSAPVLVTVPTPAA